MNAHTLARKAQAKADKALSVFRAAHGSLGVAAKQLHAAADEHGDTAEKLRQQSREADAVRLTTRTSAYAVEDQQEALGNLLGL